MIPNPDSWRPDLGKGVTIAIIKLVAKKNKVALKPLSHVAYLRKMVAHWWEQEFPGKPFPAETENYYEDLDFVQST